MGPEIELLPIWPTARRLGYRSKGAAYDPARGDIKTVSPGKEQKKIPKVWIDAKCAGELG
jgi:hypothetical protein